MNAIRNINRFIAEYDNRLYDTIHIIDNRSWWRRLFKFTIKYAGSVRRGTTKVVHNGVMVNVNYLLIVSFDNNSIKPNTYFIKYENDIIRETDSVFNDEFDKFVNHFDKVLIKNNVYCKYSYAEYTKKLKKIMRK